MAARGYVRRVRYFSHDRLTFDLDDSAGDDAGRLESQEVVVLLHGWPQDRRAWRSVTPALVEAGLRVIAPDLRGASPGARPPRPSDYEIGESVGDVIALADEVGAERIHVVGHDWGGALAWVLASRHPERVATVTVLSTPHPAAMAWAFRHVDQSRRSAYMIAFALPVVPGMVFRRLTGPFLRRTGLPDDLAQMYAERMARPGAAAASLQWYRAALPLRRMLDERVARLRRGSQGQATGGLDLTDPAARPAKDATQIVPATFVWGSKDPALGRAAAERTGVVLTRAAERAGVDPATAYRFVELDAGHWLPETRADEVAAAIVDRVRTRWEHQA